MSLLFEMPCPHCSQVVGIFSKGWQDQRANTKRVCPFCRAPVKMTLAGKAFALWFIPMIAVAGLALYVNANTVGSWLFTLAFVVPLFASFQLEKDAV